MFSASRIYSLDIETFTGTFPDGSAADGLNPAHSYITELAISTQREDVVFDNADEAKLLVEADRYIRSLKPGLLTTWNGTFFDLPFMLDRTLALYRQGAEDQTDGYSGHLSEFGMHLIPQPGLTPKYDFLPGHEVGYGCVWETNTLFRLDVHQHLDISDAYKQFADDHGIRHSLKPVADANGIPMIVVDRERMHELTPQQRHDYAVSDVRGTRTLAIKALGAQ